MGLGIQVGLRVTVCLQYDEVTTRTYVGEIWDISGGVIALKTRPGSTLLLPLYQVIKAHITELEEVVGDAE